MKLIRIIPSLLIKDGFLVKGENFDHHNYVGDIYNAVKIFSEKKAHELILLDISARKKKTTFNINIIKKIKKEIFIPLTIGGGIDNLDQVSEIIDQGVEKVCLNSNLEQNLDLVSLIANKFGSQSVIASIDVKRVDNDYFVFFENGKKKSDKYLKQYVGNLENAGCGEIILTSIDREGTRKGFDIELYKLIQNEVHLPIIAHGGASGIGSFKELFDYTDISSASAGSAFVYFGKRKAVLINYPEKKELDLIMTKYEEKNISNV
jgi:cyclase